MTFLSVQRKLYEAFLKSELVHLAIQPKGSPLAAITVRSPLMVFFILLYPSFVYMFSAEFFDMFIGAIMFGALFCSL